MPQPGRLLLLLWLLSGSCQEDILSSHKSIGETCKTDEECQSGCCNTASLNQRTSCKPPTFLLTCPRWRKPDGFTCIHHTECRSGCCNTTSNRKLTFCKSKTLFLQCLPWKKPIRAACTEHWECESQCCIKVRHSSVPQCAPRSGILAMCLPVERWH